MNFVRVGNLVLDLHKIAVANYVPGVAGNPPSPPTLNILWQGESKPYVLGKDNADQVWGLICKLSESSASGPL